MGPLGFAVLTSLGFVLELLIVEEELFTGCKSEFRPTVYTLQYLILELHEMPLSWPPWNPEEQHGRRLGLQSDLLLRVRPKPRNIFAANFRIQALPDSSYEFLYFHDAARAVPKIGTAPDVLLVLLFACLFTVAFAREGFLHAALLPGLEVKGMPLHLFYDVLLLHLAFEAAQRVLKRFTLL